jgi:hypothetical protein
MKLRAMAGNLFSFQPFNWEQKGSNKMEQKALYHFRPVFGHVGLLPGRVSKTKDNSVQCTLKNLQGTASLI